MSSLATPDLDERLTSVENIAYRRSEGVRYVGIRGKETEFQNVSISNAQTGEVVYELGWKKGHKIPRSLDGVAFQYVAHPLDVKSLPSRRVILRLLKDLES